MEAMTIFLYMSLSSLLPEAVYCCLQTWNLVVLFMLMNNICVQSFNFIRASMCKL